jgi:hypothetical protein
VTLSTPHLPTPHFDEAACRLRLAYLDFGARDIELLRSLRGLSGAALILAPDGAPRAAIFGRHTPVKDIADRLVLRVVVLSADEV